MNKAILVLEMPEYCVDCPLNDCFGECVVQSDDANFLAVESYAELKKGCPLKSVPEKKELYLQINNDKGYCEGYNACIDEILEEGKYDGE